MIEKEKMSGDDAVNDLELKLKPSEQNNKEFEKVILELKDENEKLSRDNSTKSIAKQELNDNAKKALEDDNMEMKEINDSREIKSYEHEKDDMKYFLFCEVKCKRKSELQNHKVEKHQPWTI
jgi:hypothetical protein